jgi:hypothetical protein
LSPPNLAEWLPEDHFAWLAGWSLDRAGEGSTRECATPGPASMGADALVAFRSVNAGSASSAETRVPITLGRGLVVAVLHIAVSLAAALLSGVGSDELDPSSSNVVGFVIIR